MDEKNYNGYLRTSFTHKGKRYYIYGSTKKELFEKVAIKKMELDKVEEDKVNPTLNDYYDFFYEVRRNEVSESTLRAQKSQYGVVSGVVMQTGETLGEMRIRDITRRDIYYARLELIKKGKTAQNLNICFAHLHHVFEYAVIDETIEKNPCKSIKRLKRTDETINENRHRALTVEETRKFLDAAKERNSFYINCFKFMLLTGVRVGELGALYLTDIDILDGMIHIRRTITRNEYGINVIGKDTKTKNSYRDIPLNDEIVHVVDNQKELNRQFFGYGSSAVLFKSTKGDLLKEYTVNREINRICKDAGIDYFTCHAFRNTFATRFIEQRPQDYKVLSSILGHKDVSITLNLYTHVMNDSKVNAMNDLNIIDFYGKSR